MLMGDAQLITGFYAQASKLYRSNGFYTLQETSIFQNVDIVQFNKYC